MKMLPRFILGVAALSASAAAFAVPGDQADADRRARNVDEALAKYHAQQDRQSTRMHASKHEAMKERAHDTAQSVRAFTHRQANAVRRFSERQNARSHMHSVPNPNPEGGGGNG